MSTRDPGFDVVFVPRADLPALPTRPDPWPILNASVPTPVHHPIWINGLIYGTNALTITVVNLLDEPVEAVGRMVTSGELIGQPHVWVDGHDAPSPTATAQEPHPGYGWIDPPPDDDLVAVGSWLSWRNSQAAANVVLHLRCTDSGVDLLVGGLTSYRVHDEWGNPNAFAVQLHEHGDLADIPDQSVYSSFFDQSVDVSTSSKTPAEISGSSADGKVCFLARTPDPRCSSTFQTLLILGPRPIKSLWDEKPVSHSVTYAAARRAADAEDARRMAPFRKLDFTSGPSVMGPKLPESVTSVTTTGPTVPHETVTSVTTTGPTVEHATLTSVRIVEPPPAASSTTVNQPPPPPPMTTTATTPVPSAASPSSQGVARFRYETGPGGTGWVDVVGDSPVSPGPIVAQNAGSTSSGLYYEFGGAPINGAFEAQLSLAGELGAATAALVAAYDQRYGSGAYTADSAGNPPRQDRLTSFFVPVTPGASPIGASFQGVLYSVGPQLGANGIDDPAAYKKIYADGLAAIAERNRTNPPIANLRLTLLSTGAYAGPSGGPALQARAAGLVIDAVVEAMASTPALAGLTLLVNTNDSRTGPGKERAAFDAAARSRNLTPTKEGFDVPLT